MNKRSLASVNVRAVANSDGTVTFPLSSEQPYRRYDGVEILSHDKGAVDLSFLNSGGAPLLDNHDRYTGIRAQIGVITKAWIADKRVYVTVKFSAKPQAQEVLQDVLDGIVRNVSVGYEVHKVVRNEKSEEYQVVKWKPYEASFVPVPADATVGIGRSATANGVKTMSLDRLPGEQTEAEQAAAFETALNDIRALAATHNIGQIGEAYITAQVRKGGVPSLEVFRGIARSNVPEGTALRNDDIGLDQRETRRFSVLKLARAMADGAAPADIAAAAFEIEAANAARAQADKEGRKTSGTYTLPAELMRSWNDFEMDGVRSAQLRAAIGTSAGANVIDTLHLAGRFIDNLRNSTSVMRAGATVLTGLDGPVEIPGGQANNAAAWLASEDANVAESNPTFRKITLGPKDLGSYTDLTRRMLQQTTIDIEAYVRRQIMDGIALAIDKAAIYGSGSSGQPTGLNGTAGIGSVTFAATGTTGIPTRDELINMQKAIAATNRGVDGLKWIMNTDSIGDLQKTKVDAGSGIFLMNDGANSLIGKSVIDSNQVPAGAATDNDIWLGYWADMILGFWGSLDLDRDPYAKFLSGGIRLRGIQTVDVAVQRVGSFAKGT